MFSFRSALSLIFMNEKKKWKERIFRVVSPYFLLGGIEYCGKIYYDLVIWITKGYRPRYENQPTFKILFLQTLKVVVYNKLKRNMVPTKDKSIETREKNGIFQDILLYFVSKNMLLIVVIEYPTPPVTHVEWLYIQQAWQYTALIRASRPTALICCWCWLQ